MNARLSRTAPLLLALTLSACSRQPQAPPSAATARQQAQAARAARVKELASAREELDQIPPPSKSRYLSIRTVESWNNPFLIVGKSTITLRVMNPDLTHSSAIPSNLLKPANARRTELSLRLGSLPEALSALPEEMWPYGRVVAVEEDPVAAKLDRPSVRRNIEATVQLLNDLGVVVDDWPGNNVLR